MKKRALLIVGLALMIAAAGVVYAHWQQTLTTHVAVGTGTVDMGFVNAATDDDGSVNLSDSVVSSAFIDVLDVGDNVDTFDKWGITSTVDPHGMFRYNSSTGFRGFVYPWATPRYDKDVARCTASVVGKTVTFTIENAYPSYFCTMKVDVVNNGSVPVKMQSGTFTISKTGWGPGGITPGAYANNSEWQSGPTGFLGAYFGGVNELVFDFPDGMVCGSQIDPQESNQVILWVHVEQGDVLGTNGYNQGKSYQIDWTMDFVNWNEFVPSDDCQ